jgi:hypothetical protein
MKQVTFVGRVTETYRELPWSAYGRAVPKGHPPDEKPVRVNVEVNGSLELAAILPPQAASDVQVGSIIKVVLAQGSPAELAGFEEAAAAA